MSVDVAGASRFLPCLRFEVRKTLRNRLPWVALVVVAVVTVLGGWTSTRGEDGVRSYLLLADVLEVTMPITAFFLLIMGCLSVNEEVSSGAMRAILLRPVSRGEVILSKTLALALWTAILGGMAILGAWSQVVMHGGFGDVAVAVEGLGDYVVFESDVISGHSRRLCAVTIPALLCAPMLGLTISLLVDATGSAVAAGVFLFAAMSSLATSFPESGPFMFPDYISRPIALLSELAQGIETNAKQASETGLFSSALLVPIAMSVGLAAINYAIFRRRNITC